MASATQRVILTDDVIEQLAGAIADKDLERIAYLYFKIGYGPVSIIRSNSLGDAIKFNREVIHRWRNKCKEHDEVEVCS